MTTQLLIAILLMLIAMYAAIKLVRFAARICVTVLCLGGCGFVAFNVMTGEWADWQSIIVYSLTTGFAAALLALPALPFTYAKRRE